MSQLIRLLAKKKKKLLYEIKAVPHICTETQKNQTWNSYFRQYTPSEAEHSNADQAVPADSHLVGEKPLLTYSHHLALR